MTHPTPLEITRRLIEIPTVNPPGGEGPAQDYLQGLLEGAGLSVRRLEKVPGRPNLVARLTGSGRRPPLLFYGHTDVVGVEGQAWRHPPFEAVVDDGVLYGRGALDMKAGVGMLVHAVLQARTEGLQPAGDVVLALVVDEETGGGAGMQFLLEEHPGLFDGIHHAIGEFGGFPLHAFGRRFYRIGVSQKQYAHLRLRLTGAGGHGSLPTHDTVIGQLGRVLDRLDGARMPYHQTALARRVIEAMMEALPPAKVELLGGLLDPATFDETLEAIGPGRERFESLFRDTANPTVVRAGGKFNVIPSEAAVEVDARILPGRTTSDLVAEVRSLLGDAVEVEVLAEGPTTKTDVDYSLFKVLAGILTDLDPGGVPIPYLFNESPDGRLLEAAGIQNYGFLPMNLPPEIDLPSLIHGPDERVPLAAIDFGARALIELLRRY